MTDRRRTARAAPGLALAVLTLAAPAPGSSASVARCGTPQLRVAPTFYGEAGGQFVQTFEFTNASHHACSLSGWPKLNLPTRRVRQSAPSRPAFRTVVLRTRGAGSFDVYGADWNRLANKPCHKTRTVLVTPPGARSPLSVRVTMPNCGEFYVAPVVAGAKDRDAWSVVVP